MNRWIEKFLENDTLRVLTVFIICLFIFAFGFSFLEGLDFFNSLYWAVTTSSTVGYGDYSPTTNLGKLLGMFVMISGVALLGYLISTISNSLVSLNMERVMGISKCRKEGHTILVGWNMVARNTLEELVEDEVEICVVSNESHSEVTKYKRTQFVKGDFHEKHTLKKAGIQKASHIILAMESDPDVILTISNIRQLNPKILIIGRIDNLDYSEVALSAGCDHVISPSEIGGNLLYSALKEPSVVKWIMEVTTSVYGAEVDEVRIEEYPEYKGKKLGNIDLGEDTLVVGYDKDSDGHTTTNPSPSTVLGEDDTLVVVRKSEEGVHTQSHDNATQKVKKGDVLFCGWNPTVRSAVEELINGIQITVLTDNIERGERRHYEKRGVKFIDGAVSRLNLLAIDLKKMHNVVLGMEEDSKVILLSYVVKNVDPSINLVARIDEADNNEAAFKAGADHVVSPAEVGGRLLAMATSHPSAVSWIMDTTTTTRGANIKELVLKEHKELAGKKIKDIKLPKGTSIVGLDRDSDSIVEILPDKKTVVSIDDTLVVLEQ